MFGLEITDVGGLVAVATAAVGWVAKWKSNRVIEEGREALDAVRVMISELKDVEAEVQKARADGKLDEKEINKISDEIIQAVRAGETAYVQVSEALHAAKGMLPKSVRGKIEPYLIAR